MPLYRHGHANSGFSFGSAAGNSSCSTPRPTRILQTDCGPHVGAYSTNGRLSNWVLRSGNLLRDAKNWGRDHSCHRPLIFLENTIASAIQYRESEGPEPAAPESAFLDLNRLIDGVLARCRSAGIPPIPAQIATSIASVFCRGFSEDDYKSYRYEIEKIVPARWAAFILRTERIDVDVFRNGN